MISFITGNKNKFAEAEAILGLPLVQQPLDLEEIQGSLEEIAKHKCILAAELTNGPVLVEDSALEFTAWGTLPGPYIKWFYNSLGNEGLCTALKGFQDHSATSVCTYAYSRGPGSEPILFQGRVKGTIVSPRGKNGFAFDPIFEVDGQTYAEMEPDVKNALSERYLALMEFKRWITKV
ncbi:hypothetical protein ASPZODRAFT_68790 [Penicilliopsis zonata CBS 506.65]|uniref:XTP/dITP diphosphatase n=1 Tax=Penicilliopsis zonata CBS 506.65 TaxID=1073090 RepID=A0A1L9SFI4_9EURO|nr:hypothetical protein ASPZODRAFT_68790 [Penicilliopsis zonata CBS 506.65]OJJ45912.1 hypothetical protein ASPZODRAFT_68790 [Penicilliopsis zonata CBS 506.65]